MAWKERTVEQMREEFARRVLAQNKPAVVLFNGTAYAYLYNLQGDVIALVDSNGAQVVKYTYDCSRR